MHIMQTFDKAQTKSKAEIMVPAENINEIKMLIIVLGNYAGQLQKHNMTLFEKLQ